MPQMSPLMWSELFVLFSALLLLAMIKIYFMKIPNSSQTLVNEKEMNTSLKLYWAW